MPVIVANDLSLGSPITPDIICPDVPGIGAYMVYLIVFYDMVIPWCEQDGVVGCMVNVIMRDYLAHPSSNVGTCSVRECIPGKITNLAVVNLVVRRLESVTVSSCQRNTVFATV